MDFHRMRVLIDPNADYRKAQGTNELLRRELNCLALHVLETFSLVQDAIPLVNQNIDSMSVCRQPLPNICGSFRRRGETIYTNQMTPHEPNKV